MPSMNEEYYKFYTAVHEESTKYRTSSANNPLNLSDITTNVITITFFLSRVIDFKSLLQPHQKYYITQYEEIGFS